MAKSNNTAPVETMRPSSGRLAVRIVGVLLALLVVVVVLFAWNRWFRYDDAADLQGVWIDEAGAQLAMDGSRMLVGDSVVYDYTVDAATKTIAYEFNGTKGYSAYRFSGDRALLALRDVGQGGGTDWLMALHIKEDPLLAALDPQAQTPEGCSRMQRTSASADEAFAAYEARPTGVQSAPSETVVWPEDMTSSVVQDDQVPAQGQGADDQSQDAWQDPSTLGGQHYEEGQQSWQDDASQGRANGGYSQ